MNALGELRDRISRLKDRLRGGPPIDVAVASQPPRGPLIPHAPESHLHAAKGEFVAPPRAERVRQLAWKFEQARATLELIAESKPDAANCPPEVIGGIHKLHVLLDFAIEIAATDSMATSTAVVGGLEELRARVDREMTELSGWVDGAAGRQGQLARIVALHRALSEGRPGVADELNSLADDIVARVERDWHPVFEATSAREPVEILACRSLNAALVTAFLTGSSVEWRARRRSLVAAALAQNVGILAAAAESYFSTQPLAGRALAEVERHPTLAANLLHRVRGLENEAIRAVAEHHERLDGSGYPERKQADALAAEGKVLAIADAFVGLRSDRPDRPASSLKHAISAILKDAEANKLDRQLACKLLDLSFYPVGALVELSTGEIAEVAAPQETADRPDRAAQPVVRICRDAEGGKTTRGAYRNLAFRPDCRVVRSLSRAETEELFWS